MTARQDLLQAARGLASEGQVEFSPAEIVACAREAGSTYPDTTLRTHVLGPMCANSPDHHGVNYGDFVRVARGRYRLVEHADSEIEYVPAPTVTPQSGSADAGPTTDPQAEWHWEGNVQSAVVRHLAGRGWQIRRVADTSARQSGYDVEAVKGDERVIVEVKGYPSSRYVRGPKRGQPKRTQPPLQARHWFATALLWAAITCEEKPEARVVLALPAFDTYRTLGRRTRSTRRAAGIEVWIVDPAGDVEPMDDHQGPRSA